MSGRIVPYENMGMFDGWGRETEYGKCPTVDDLRTGALIRIAGALERIATRMEDIKVGVNTSEAQKFKLWQERIKEDEAREARDAVYHRAIKRAAEIFSEIPASGGARNFIIRRWGICVGIDGMAIDPLSDNAAADLLLPHKKREAYEAWRLAKIAAANNTEATP